jgi:hypothetical protein
MTKIKKMRIKKMTKIKKMRIKKIRMRISFLSD